MRFHASSHQQSSREQHHPPHARTEVGNSVHGRDPDSQGLGFSLYPQIGGHDTNAKPGGKIQTTILKALNADKES